ncbi:catalase family peroxidase [Acetobacteraceae bacterium KSS8]|uniref:Catalase-related peroxidase n=1 Tax=Endosaccharibacter trunci TaxID=2812733 RepID=A0ABT1W619_9PROT|nr:catalase family peroxidase [Acetobacteraceae bacterium KSS8]
MPPEPRPPGRAPIAPLAGIAAVVVVLGGAFAYAGGFLSPSRLSPVKLVNAFGQPASDALGHRRNHAKGICFTGRFDSSGQAAAISRAALFAAGASAPVIGRFNLGTPVFASPDDSVRVRGMSIDIRPNQPGEWRSAMINAPIFPVSTPADFYALLLASGSKDQGAMPRFIAAHPGFAPFGAWATKGPWTGSYAEERYNGLNSFRVTDQSGTVRTVRWSMLPAAPVQNVDPATLKDAAPDALEKEITDRVTAAPQRWTLQFTVAAEGDPTADPSKPWPAGRQTIDAGTLVVDKIEPEADGPCRDINYDPTVLPDGMTTSDDPFPAARSSAYAVSFNRRTAEAADYPRTETYPETGGTSQ